MTWDREKGSVTEGYSITSGMIRESSFIQEKYNLIFSFGFQGEFYVNNYINKNTTKFENGHTNKVTGAFMHPENSQIVYSFGDDGKIIRWQYD